MADEHFPIEQKLFSRKAFLDNLPAILIIISVILISVLRDTRYFTMPRFWAEEGTRHFTFSYSHGWFQSLFQPQVGYLNFWPNLATKISLLGALENAPIVTTLMALLVQLVPVALILWSKSPLWDNWYRKLAAVVIITFAPLTGEVWLNSVNSYNFFAIITFLILIEDAPEQSTRKWVYRILLLLGGLTGTLSCFLIPFFILRVFFEKKIERWWQIAILSACALVQISLILSYRSSDNRGLADRFHLLGPAGLGAAIWMQTITLFSLGVERAGSIAKEIYTHIQYDLNGFQIWGLLMLIGAIGIFILLSSNIPIKTRLIFLGSYATLVFLPMMFSVITDKYALMETGIHQRLFLAPNTIFGLMLLVGIRFQKNRGWKAAISNLASILCLLLVSVSIFWGIYFYRSTGFKQDYWPNWKNEVQTWKTNPQFKLQIQPEPWYITLKAR